MSVYSKALQGVGRKVKEALQPMEAFLAVLVLGARGLLFRQWLLAEVEADGMAVEEQAHRVEEVEVPLSAIVPPACT